MIGFSGSTRKIGRLRVVALNGTSHRAVLLAGMVAVPCALGRSGSTRHKREGDGATPVGRFRLLGGYFRADRLARPSTSLKLRTAKPIDGWCDAPDSGRYNRYVRLPFAASHETLVREDHAYDIVLMLDHNQRPRMRGAGSAIFFHLADQGLHGTAGCISLRMSDMRRLLPRLAARCTIQVG